MKVCIDPGHGGRDPGAVGRISQEKNINLEVGRLLQNELTRYQAGIVMTRTTDVDVSLQRRAEIANQNLCDWFISIHCNSAGTASARGIETYCYQRGGQGERMAQVIQNYLVRANPNTVNRGVKTANFYVLRNTSMPAVLIELMFISNPEEERILNNADWQRNTAKGMADQLAFFWGLKSEEQPSDSGTAEPPPPQVPQSKHYAQDAHDQWRRDGILKQDHDLTKPITWGEYIITQERLRNRE